MTRLPSLPSIASPRLAGQSFRALSRYRQPKMTPEEEESLLRKFGGTVLSGLTTVGHILDTPGSIVRGLLAGEPGRAFGGILEPSERVYGREMLENWGMLGPNKRGLDVGDVAGFGAEVVLDPLFWSSGLLKGALSKSGMLARKAGLLKNLRLAARPAIGKRLAMMTTTPRKLIQAGMDIPAGMAAFEKAAGARAAEYLDRPLGGLLNIGPLGLPWATVGTGPTAQRIAKGMDVAGRRIAETAPARFAKMLFHYPSKGLYRPAEQALAASVTAREPAARAAGIMVAKELDEPTQALVKSIDELYGKQLRGVVEPATDFGKGYKVGDIVYAADRQNYGRVQRMSAEGAKVYFKNPQTGASTLVDLPHEVLKLAHPASSRVAEEYALDLVRDATHRIVRHVGERPQGGVEEAFRLIMPKAKLPPPDVAADISTAALQYRKANLALKQSIRMKGGNTRLIETSDLFAHMPRYAEMVEEGLGETRLGGLGWVGEKARRDALRYLPSEVIEQIVADPESYSAATGADTILAKWGRFLGGDKKLYGGFGNPTAQKKHAAALAEYLQTSNLERLRQGGRRLFSPDLLAAELRYQKAGHRVSAIYDAIHEQFNLNLGKEGVPLRDAYKKVGMNPDRAISYLADSSGRSSDDLLKLRVPEDVVAAPAALIRKLQRPEWGNRLTSLVDKLNQWWKQHVTLLFPGFWNRNHTWGQVQNLISEMVETPKDLATYGTAYKETMNYLLHPDKMPSGLAKELDAYGIAAPRIGFEGVEAVGQRAGQLTPGAPWAIGEMYQAALRSAPEATSRLGRIARPVSAAQRALLGAGSRVNQAVEFMNRVTPYVYMTRHKGWAAEAAAQMVKMLQFNYAELTGFEKSVMRRLIPFYTFARKLAGVMTDELLQRPGGRMGQMIKATARAYAPGEAAPPYVQAGTAIPLPPGPEGHKRYLTGLGMGYEDVLQFGPTPRQAGYEVLSRLTPLLKWPLEATTGQSFFRQRSLRDLDPTIGRIIANIRRQKELPTAPRWLPMSAIESAAVNTPLSRYLTSLRVATDPRKEAWNRALNLLTGMRVTDVSPAAEEATRRDIVRAAMQAYPEARVYENVYFPKEALERMPPKQRAAAEHLMIVMNILRERAKRRASSR